jgi:phage-related tail protein
VDATSQSALLVEKLDENTQISKEAFNEANHVNQKIAKLTEAYDRVASRATKLEIDVDNKEDK